MEPAITDPAQNPAQGNTDGGVDPGAGQSATSFIDSLPEDLRGSEQLKGFDSIETLARSHLELAQAKAELEGKVPQIPEKATDYEVQIPEGVVTNEAMLEGFKTWAHEAKLSKEQAAMLGAKYLEFEQQEINRLLAAEKAAQEKTLADLKAEWGAEFDAKYATMDRALKQFASAEDQKYLTETGIGNNPALVRMFYRIGKAMADDTLAPGDGAQGSRVERTPSGHPMLNYPSMQK